MVVDHARCCGINVTLLKRRTKREGDQVFEIRAWRGGYQNYPCSNREACMSGRISWEEEDHDTHCEDGPLFPRDQHKRESQPMKEKEVAHQLRDLAILAIS